MLRIGIISPSEIAFRRFLPALSKNTDFEFVGVAVASKQEWFGQRAESVDEPTWESIKVREMERANPFIENYGGKIYEGYESLMKDSSVDCVYIPLPPALHFKWAKLALESNKHVFVEKPSTTSLNDTQALVDLARKHNLALHENYMFAYHSQLDYIDNLVASGEIGEVRLYRLAFGFPLRKLNDFRYNKVLGGGALLDCGGYVLKYAAKLLGPTAKIDYARLNNIEGFEVDMYGSAAMSNESGATVQLAFGMDHNYKCELEIWGSKGTFYTNRVLTAPEGLEPDALIRQGNEEKHIKLPADDAFSKSIQIFKECVVSKSARLAEYEALLCQEQLLEQFKNKL